MIYSSRVFIVLNNMYQLPTKYLADLEIEIESLQSFIATERKYNGDQDLKEEKQVYEDLNKSRLDLYMRLTLLSSKGHLLYQKALTIFTSEELEHLLGGEVDHEEKAKLFCDTYLKDTDESKGLIGELSILEGVIDG